MYKKMIEDAKANGLTSEKIMWKSVDSIDEILCIVKQEHPDMYWNFMRKQHGMMYGNHYTMDFALWDVEQMKPYGMYWTIKQVEEETKGMSFPNGTTLYDRFVALNATKNDLGGVFKDEDIIKAAYAFWFCDKDWKDGKSSTKVWEYMCLNYSN